MNHTNTKQQLDRKFGTRRLLLLSSHLPHNNTETDNTRVYLFCKTTNNKISFEHIKENIIVNFIFLTNSIG